MANGTNLATLGPALPVLPLFSLMGVPKNVHCYIFILQHIILSKCEINIVFLLLEDDI